MTTDEERLVASRLTDLSGRIGRLEEALTRLFGPHPTVEERLAELERPGPTEATSAA